MNGRGFVDVLWQDAIYGLRQLRRNAGFTVVAAITLALAIGANTAIFSVVNQVLLRPLPYRDAGRLAWITERFALSFSPGAVLGPDYVAWRQRNQTFEQIEGFLSSQGPAISLSGIGQPVPVRTTSVTVGLFPMLGLRPIAGRLFAPEEGQAGRDGVLLLSESLWRAQFGGSSAVLGKTVRLNSYGYTVVGVMPANVQYPQADVWTPLVLNSSLFQPRSRPLALVSVIGRLRAGMVLGQAEADLARISHGLDGDYPAQLVQSRDRRIAAVPLRDVLIRNVRALLLILLGATGFVFLIACANVANLSFSRATARYREFAIRGALGAGRVRLVRQLLTESLLLAAVGGALGLLGGLWSVGLLRGLIPAGLADEVALDPLMLVFAMGITILATLVSGVAPAIVASRAEAGETLKAGGARAGTGSGTHQLRRALVVCEIALSLVLLVGAGLLARSFLRLTNAPLGFNPGRVLMTQVSRPMTNGFQTPSQVPFFNAVLRNLRALPGVTEAGAVSRAPLSTCEGYNGPIRLRGAEADLQSVCMTSVTPGYFRAMEVPLLKGRGFSDGDSAEAPGVVIMNETLAREAFGNRDPIGQTAGVYGLGGISWRTVVGVVADARNSTLEQQTWAEIFVPYPQALLPLSATFVLRAGGDPRGLAGGVRTAVEAVDRNQAVSNMETLEEAIDRSSTPQWFRTRLLGLFALVALVLAAAGVFGVMAYSVSQRTHEMGVRVALGAQPGDIVRLAVGECMLVAAIGLGLGVVGAVGVTRWLSSFLYDVKATDLPTFAGALMLLAATALAAGYIPARRASRQDPLAALRNE